MQVDMIMANAYAVVKISDFIATRYLFPVFLTYMFFEDGEKRFDPA
jgi:hypothetical protein